MAHLNKNDKIHTFINYCLFFGDIDGLNVEISESYLLQFDFRMNQETNYV